MKTLFPNEDKDSNQNPTNSRVKELTLTVPSVNKYREMYGYLNRVNKEFFQIRLQKILKLLTMGYIELKYTNPDYDESWFASLQIGLKKRKSALQKEDLVSLYILLVSSIENSLEVIKATIGSVEKEIVAEMVESGPVTLKYSAEKLGIKDRDYAAVSAWFLHSDSYSQWSKFTGNSVLKMYARYAYGYGDYARNWGSGSYYLTPSAPLVLYITNPQFPAPLEPKTMVPSENFEEQFINFSGMDIIEAIPTIALLVNTGMIKSGKTKIGIMAGRKINDSSQLVALPPGTSRQNRDRPQILAILSLLIKGDSNYQDTSDTQKWLKSIYQVMMRFPEELLNFLLENSIRTLPVEFRMYCRGLITMAMLSVQEVLVNVYRLRKDSWIDASWFSRAAMAAMAEKGVAVIYPITEEEGSVKVKDLDGDPLSMNVYKKRIQDVIFSGILSSFASIGAVDALYDSKGKLCYLRLSALGAWYTGETGKFPENNLAGKQSPAEAFACDDETLIVCIKDTDHPSVPILRDSAEKISTTRYVLNVSKLLSGCKSKPELEEKIRRLRMYVLPNPGKKIEEFFTDVLGRCNLVERTPGGSEYTLYDINPNNKELLGLLTSDETIRQYTLKVEGCRLLVKNSFQQAFFEKLRKAGFLNNVQSK